MSTAVFSSSRFAVPTAPKSQPARVNGTHGAGVIVPGLGAGLVVAGGDGAYTIDGLVSWPAAGVDAVSKTGSVQWANEPAPATGKPRRGGPDARGRAGDQENRCGHGYRWLLSG